MRVSSVYIENFRAIKSAGCSFDSVTTLIGPNGSGKSTVLRALDWFFNGMVGGLTKDDLHGGSISDGPARVRVDFDSLTDADRSALGSRYGNAKFETFTVWKTWSDGCEKITARAFAYPPFETIRAVSGAVERRQCYKELRQSKPELNLPAATSAAAVEAAMDEWEQSHPEALTEAEVSDTHFFGFNSRGKLAELFDFVFVSADLRAGDETSDTRDATLGRILQHALDRGAFSQAAAVLAAKFADDFDALSREHLEPQLYEIGRGISEQIAEFVPGRSVRLHSEAPPAKSHTPRVEATISDGVISTPVTHQGHGLQRTLLLSALTVLSRISRTRVEAGDVQMFLAIEEPELYQHPTQARAFASVLRSIASDSSSQVQVAYATHSPHFVEPRFFDQVRRVSSVKFKGASCAEARISSVSVDEIASDLEGYVLPGSVKRRFNQICLKALSEALFAESVILVEGDEDAALIQGLGDKPNELALEGIAVAAVGGKSNMLLPYAVLKRLGIQCLMVVDNDSGCRDRMVANQKGTTDIERAEQDQIKANRLLCRFVGALEQDFPIGAVCKSLVFVKDTIESVVEVDLPGWGQTRKRLISEGRAVEGKHAASYELAARECSDEPSGELARILSLVRESRAA